MRKHPYLSEIGRKIQRLRKERGMSGRAFATLCGLDYSNVSRIELGEKNIHILTLKLIAEKLEVRIEDLI